MLISSVILPKSLSFKEYCSPSLIIICFSAWLLKDCIFKNEYDMQQDIKLAKSQFGHLGAANINLNKVRTLICLSIKVRIFTRTYIRK